METHRKNWIADERWRRASDSFEKLPQKSRAMHRTAIAELKISDGFGETRPWSYEEDERLVGLIEKHKLPLYGSFSGLANQDGHGTTHLEKSVVWDSIELEFQGMCQ